MLDSKIMQGNALRYMRVSANKTLEQSAKVCNHKKTWLSEIEHGRKNVLFNDAKKLCSYYGYTLDDLSNMIDSEIARRSKLAENKE